MEWFQKDGTYISYDKCTLEPECCSVYSSTFVINELLSSLFIDRSPTNVCTARICASSDRNKKINLGDFELIVLKTNLSMIDCMNYCEDFISNKKLNPKFAWYDNDGTKIELKGNRDELRSFLPELNIESSSNQIVINTNVVDGVSFRITSDREGFNLFYANKGSRGFIAFNERIEALMDNADEFAEDYNFQPQRELNTELVDLEFINKEFIAISPSFFFMGAPKTEDVRSDLKERQHIVLLTKPFEMMRTVLTDILYYNIKSIANNRGTKTLSNLTISEKGLPVRSHQVEFRKICGVLNDIDNNYFYRLPTEAEWEYCCRAGNSGPRYGLLDDIAWYKGNSNNKVHPAGLKQPNAWGFFDMLGNVYEWTCDVFKQHYLVGKTNFILHPIAATVDPGFPATKTNINVQKANLAVLKGGEFSSDNPRAAMRASADIEDASAFSTGARLVRFKVSAEEKVKLRAKYEV